MAAGSSATPTEEAAAAQGKARKDCWVVVCCYSRTLWCRPVLVQLAGTVRYLTKATAPGTVGMLCGQHRYRVTATQQFRGTTLTSCSQCRTSKA